MVLFWLLAPRQDQHQWISFSFDGPAHSSVPSLDITHLVPVVQELCAAGIVPATERVHRLREGRLSYILYPNQPSNIPSVREGPDVCSPPAHLELGKWKYQESLGSCMPWPNNEWLRWRSKLSDATAGVTRATPQCTRIRLSFTLWVLMELKRLWQQADDKDEARLLWASAYLCFLVSWGQERLQYHQRKSTITNHTCVMRMSKWTVMWPCPIFRSQ